jgi:hypothetical protein
MRAKLLSLLRAIGLRLMMRPAQLDPLADLLAMTPAEVVVALVNATQRGELQWARHPERRRLHEGEFTHFVASRNGRRLVRVSFGHSRDASTGARVGQRLSHVDFLAAPPGVPTPGGIYSWYSWPLPEEAALWNLLKAVPNA